MLKIVAATLATPGPMRRHYHWKVDQTRRCGSVKKGLVEVRLKEDKSAITLFVGSAHLHMKSTMCARVGTFGGWCLTRSTGHHSVFAERDGSVEPRMILLW